MRKLILLFQKILLITYHGELKLTHGHAYDLTTIRRNGDVTLRYDALYLHILLPLEFEILEAKCDYSAKLMHLGPSGRVEASVKSAQIYADILIDLKGLKLSLQDFEIEEIK